MATSQPHSPLAGLDAPLAITMWDFSWIERRWSGAGYEDWDQALDELTERGYNAVRIDAFPHLLGLIHGYAEVGLAHKRPLITTECWGIIDYKDWPLLDWGWVKELCELGTLTASATGQWAAVATSNFCGPQFVGMWRDIAWHQRLTGAIKSAPLPTGLGAS
ncbi:MAG: hypothetical protein NTV93_13555 [Verrucomicrobia bacterium]|nr:hypothetical protein [Verrucomicrobiota bacterium]